MTNKRKDVRLSPLSISGSVNSNEKPTSVHIDNISLGGAKISYRSSKDFEKCGVLHLKLEDHGEITTPIEFLEVAKNTARIEFKNMSFKERLLLTYFIENYSLIPKH